MDSRVSIQDLVCKSLDRAIVHILVWSDLQQSVFVWSVFFSVLPRWLWLLSCVPGHFGDERQTIGLALSKNTLDQGGITCGAIDEASASSKAMSARNRKLSRQKCCSCKLLRQNWYFYLFDKNVMICQDMSWYISWYVMIYIMIYHDMPWYAMEYLSNWFLSRANLSYQ